MSFKNPHLPAGIYDYKTLKRCNRIITGIGTPTSHKRMLFIYPSLKKSDTAE
jgi:hypothetical protein